MGELPRHGNSSKNRSMPSLFPIADVCRKEKVRENVMISPFSFFFVEPLQHITISCRMIFSVFIKMYEMWVSSNIEKI